MTSPRGPGRSWPARAKLILPTPSYPGTVGSSLCDLVVGWVSGKVQEGAERHQSLFGMITRRVRSIARRAAAGQAAPLFERPDPCRRMDRSAGAGQPPAATDRNAPRRRRLRRRAGPLEARAENRETTLREAGSLAGEFAAALRHALGAEGEPIGPTASLWAAAARREPPGAMTLASRNATRTAAPMPGSPRVISSASGPRSAADTPGLRSSSSGNRPARPRDGAISPDPISMMIPLCPGSTRRGPRPRGRWCTNPCSPPVLGVLPGAIDRRGTRP